MLSSTYTKEAVAFFSLFSLAFAAGCYPRAATYPKFSLADGRKLQNDLLGNVFTPKLEFPLYIEASHTATFSLGSVIACLENVNKWSDTHITQADIAHAVQNILDECDHGDGTSKG